MKYQRFTPPGGKDIEIRKFEFVAKTQFLYRDSNDQIQYEGIFCLFMNNKNKIKNKVFKDKAYNQILPITKMHVYLYKGWK